MPKKIKVGQKYWYTPTLTTKPIEIMIKKGIVLNHLVNSLTQEFIETAPLDSLVNTPFGRFFTTKMGAEIDNEYFNMVHKIEDLLRKDGRPKKQILIEDLNELKDIYKKLKKVFK